MFYMSQAIPLNKFKLKDYNLGYVKLQDGTIIILRAAVVDVKPLQISSPFEPEFNVIIIGGVSVYPSDSALNEVKDKPIIGPNETVLSGWTLIDIVEKQSAYEEVEYFLNGKGKYVIRAEIEPILAAKNSNYRTIQNEPLYFVRWVNKVSWKKCE